MISDLVDYLNNNLLFSIMKLQVLLLAEKGHDIKNIYNQISQLYNGEYIIPLNKRNTKSPKLLPQENPVCKTGLVMWKDVKFSYNGRTRQKFYYPLKNSENELCPCHHKNFYNGKKHRDCTKYITVPDDLRLSIDRNSQYYKSTYPLRAECKHYNSRFKNTGKNVCGYEFKHSLQISTPLLISVY
ncbi:hypothetical protein [Eubacterium sp. An3]|uniref:hypothetical protein n=1 Tax=Eubacterium sp. An3 TaxID=1965628 RepID=UPI001FA83E39|nr:hypothetical protein [Eubacterium sp. An3]